MLFLAEFSFYFGVKTLFFSVKKMKYKTFVLKLFCRNEFFGLDLARGSSSNYFYAFTLY